MNVRDRVSLKDAQGTHYGVITVMRVDGLCSVKWDSGITELVPESELVFVESPAENAYTRGEAMGVPPAEAKDTGGAPYVTESGKVLADAEIEELSREAEQGYDVSRGAPSVRDRIASWLARLR